MNNKMLVFVIPFAGGSSISFSQWKSIDTKVQYIFLDPPGKGSRMNETLVNTMEDMVFDIKKQIEDYVTTNDVEEYIIMGHSMGGSIAYEIVNLMMEEGKKPKYVILSATTVPDEFDLQMFNSIVIEDESFEKYLCDFGLVNEKMIKNVFFRKKYLPIVKNDYTILTKYVPSIKKRNNVKAIILYGNRDQVSGTGSRVWRNYFIEEPLYYEFDGGHFFIFDYFEKINNIVEAL